ncbi:MAG: hypothetical protein GWP19_04870 [Planctomycetia bacterium]|nr:hypothetical protein [Planctomycetia bacterium]
MKRLLIIIPLLFWFSCEDENEKISNNLIGLWEIDMREDGYGELFAPGYILYWIEITENIVRDRDDRFKETDTTCYTDWSNEFPYQLFDSDSGTISVIENHSLVVGRVGVKVENDRIYYYKTYTGTPYISGVKSKESDFTPSCE